MKENAGNPAQDAARTVAAAQMRELLLSFEPTKFAAALSDEPELYLGLVNALSRLTEAEAETLRQRSHESVNTAKLNNSEKVSDKKLLSENELKDLAREMKIM